MFRKMRGIRLSEEKQGLIFFTCLCFADRPDDVKDKIRRLCADVGGDYRQALFDCVTSRRSIDRICLDHFLSPSLLYDLRRKFYEAW